MNKTQALAHYIWDYFRRHGAERPATENWFLAERILRGERPAWLFGREDFRPFGLCYSINEGDHSTVWLRKISGMTFYLGTNWHN